MISDIAFVTLKMIYIFIPKDWKQLLYRIYIALIIYINHVLSIFFYFSEWMNINYVKSLKTLPFNFVCGVIWTKSDISSIENVNNDHPLIN